MADWSEQVRAALRRLRLGGRVVLGSGREIVLSGDMISELTIQEGTSGALQPGSVLCAECVLDLCNDAGQWSAGGEYLGQGILSGATLMPELGILGQNGISWKPLGVYEVADVCYMEGEGKLRLRAKDSIVFELAARFEDELSYPCSLQTLWEYAVSQTGYLWSGNVRNGASVIDARPEWKDASMRSVLGYIATAAGCFVRLDRNGALALCPLWQDDAPIYTLDCENYMNLESSDMSYGPVDALRLKCVDGQQQQVFTGESGSALFALSIAENPLYQEGSAGLNALARGTLAAVAGFKSEGMSFQWRGDPMLLIGDRLKIVDRRDAAHEGVLTRQTLQFGQGFSANCVCEIPDENNAGVRRAITPEGGLNSAALVGAVNGALLSVGSVTTNKLAAGSITAEKLAAGAVDAGALSAITAKISTLTAKDIETDRLAAALAAFTIVTAGTATFDRATIQHLVAEAMHLSFGEAGTVFVRNLAVEYAQMIGAAIGNLCIKASDGNYYNIDVNQNGTVTAAKATVSAGEIAAGQTYGGQVILETNITAANLSAGNLLATYALVNRIDAARIDVDELFAREAFIDMLRTSRIFADKSLEIIVGEADSASRVFRQENFPDGDVLVKAGDMLVQPSTGKQYQAVQTGSISFALDGNGDLYYDYAGEGSMSMDGFYLCTDGFAFSVAGDIGKPYEWVLVRDLELQAKLNAQAEQMAETVIKINKDIEGIQDQLDGNITTWFEAYVPTNSNAPASTWTTADQKNQHLGDLFYVNNAALEQNGYCYRWQQTGGTYSWVRVSDSGVTKALADAAKAQDTADKKRRVFVAQPAPPYDVGDLWAQGSGGDLMRCSTAKADGQSYAAGDWVKASKYTDDTKANAAQNAANTAQSTANSAQSAANGAQETADMAGNYANEALDKANNALTQAEFKRVVRIDDEGLHVGDNLTGQELLLASGHMNVVINNVNVATYADKFIRLGNMQIRKVRGGLAISVYKS